MSELRGVSRSCVTQFYLQPDINDHTPAIKAGTRFTYPGGMEGWVDLGDMITPRPGIEPTTAWSKVRSPNRCVSTAPDCRQNLLSKIDCDPFSRRTCSKYGPVLMRLIVFDSLFLKYVTNCGFLVQLPSEPHAWLSKTLTINLLV